LLEDPKIWDNLERSQDLNRERVALERSLKPILSLSVSVSDSLELADLAAQENDLETLELVTEELVDFQKIVDELEFTSIFSRKMDPANAFVDIRPGSGGTEAQDWAEMLFKMYDHWAVKKGFKVEIVDYSPGDVAGIKNATLKLIGDYAFGWIRTENGIHRLVRKSPFDSGQRRHTSFASVFAYPEVDKRIDIEIDPGDLRIDTYRASGAGGQHVNRTDSAVRITHKPSGVVVQCQNERSQHRNKAEAMSMLRARLYELEQQKSEDERKKIEDSKPDISWGNQIRSYVLDQSRIKDIRTGVETGNVNAVLLGDLDMFIEASLKAGL
jgi:peptide chain release factor 2